MNSALAEKPRLGARQPRILWLPEAYGDADLSHGHDACELAESVGLVADGWQQDVAVAILATRSSDGRWLMFEFALEVARQNGKGGVYEIRELYGLFVLGERLLVHTAHEYKTAEQALDRMEALIDGCDDLRREVKTIKRSHGQEGVYLKSGASLRYGTRTSGAFRGWSIDFFGYDEAMHIKDSMHSSSFPTMSARPNAQILYAGSAVDQDTMPDGVVFARLRRRAIAGGDPRLGYMGWSAPFEHPSEVTPDDARDPANWAAANPAYGTRVTGEYIETEQRALSARGFAAERLGVGDWPDTSEDADRKIPRALWAATLDASSRRSGPVAFAVEVSRDRQWSTISVAGARADGKWHGEIVDRRPGTDWVLERWAELDRTHRPIANLYDSKGPAASLIGEAKNLKIRRLTPVNAGEVAQACGVIFDAITHGTFKRGPQPELDAAVDGAVDRPLVDAWAWDRKNSTVDISPLVSVTFALWAVVTRQRKRGGAVDVASLYAQAQAEAAALADALRS